MFNLYERPTRQSDFSRLLALKHLRTTALPELQTSLQNFARVHRFPGFPDPSLAPILPEAAPNKVLAASRQSFQRTKFAWVRPTRAPAGRN